MPQQADRYNLEDEALEVLEVLALSKGGDPDQLGNALLSRMLLHCRSQSNLSLREKTKIFVEESRDRDGVAAELAELKRAKVEGRNNICVEPPA